MFQPFLILRDALSTLLVLANFTRQEQKAFSDFRHQRILEEDKADGISNMELSREGAPHTFEIQ